MGSPRTAEIRAGLCFKFSQGLLDQTNPETALMRSLSNSYKVVAANATWKCWTDIPANIFVKQVSFDKHIFKTYHFDHMTTTSKDPSSLKITFLGKFNEPRTGSKENNIFRNCLNTSHRH